MQRRNHLRRGLQWGSNLHREHLRAIHAKPNADRARYREVHLGRVPRRLPCVCAFVQGILSSGPSRLQRLPGIQVLQRPDAIGRRYRFREVHDRVHRCSLPEGV
jgi:hypothetical protein